MEANSESRGHNTQKKVLGSNCNLGMIDRKP